MDSGCVNNIRRISDVKIFWYFRLLRYFRHFMGLFEILNVFGRLTLQVFEFGRVYNIERNWDIRHL